MGSRAIIRLQAGDRSKRRDCTMSKQCCGTRQGVPCSRGDVRLRSMLPGFLHRKSCTPVNRLDVSLHRNSSYIGQDICQEIEWDLSQIDSASSVGNGRRNRQQTVGQIIRHCIQNMAFVCSGCGRGASS